VQRHADDDPVLERPGDRQRRAHRELKAERIRQRRVVVADREVRGRA
jgi:hypothetical protein